MPMNTFNNKKPFTATIKSVETITGPKASGETCNIVIETRGEIPFWEGQSYGVIPPVRQRFCTSHTCTYVRTPNCKPMVLLPTELSETR